MIPIVECFYYEESPMKPGMYGIYLKHDNLRLAGTTGSYNILMARLLNLSYAQFLRFCRDVCGGEIVGKNTKYPTVFFHLGSGLYQLVKLLNQRATLVLWERDHPDWKQHQEIVQQHNREKK